MSTTLAIVVVASCVGLALVVAIICGALVEVFRQLADIRSALDLDDRPLPLDLRGEAIHAKDLGLPESIGDLPEAIVIFLSSKCATCLSIAQAFRGGAPSSVWFVLEGGREASGLKSLLNGCSRVLEDIGGEKAGRIGLDVTPSVLTVRFGEVTRAHAVSSARQVLSLVPTTATWLRCRYGQTRSECSNLRGSQFCGER